MIAAILEANGETIIWMIIATVIIAGTFLGMWYWDGFLDRLHEREKD